MWTSGNPGTSHYSSDDDDLMDLEFLSMSDEDEVEKIPQRTFMVTGQEWTKFLMTEHPQTIKDLLRVNQHTFRTLVDLLVAKGQLKWDHMRLLVEESLAIFLYICGQSEQHRVAAHWFQHSTDTISRHFKVMRRALCSVAPFVIRPPDLEVTPPEILNDGRYYPWFKDCVGAIDGTHIDAWASESREVAYRGRKSRKTQNVMAVCSFDMKFTYIFPGWEGSAHNGRVFLSVVTNLDYKFPNPPIIMAGSKSYYVVFKGFILGIYDSWAACSRQVIGFKGAIYKKYPSWDEAYTAWRIHNTQVDEMLPPPRVPLLEDQAGSLTNLDVDNRDECPLYMIIGLSFCMGVIVAIVIQALV
ncbi:hypothetical protein Vadar_007664 [Vaccinium darrowii]|uniref:Uncharacterized protein n=1 Tax=Vaccinium darrowii TaxID=229202 RepID=A0ACB7YDD5_9ERIC|nr:hypothetical protein Vadar_007664 [Vaccinium darrowii]